jgi:ABC-type nitrate/sulfonate/bicarbonate transport system substrate-binding protein
VAPEVNVIYFEVGSAEITPDARVVLKTIVDYLKQEPTEKIVLSSFSDPTGSTAVNRKILAQRSLAARKFIIDNGITEDRVASPASAIKSVPKDYPKDQYWRLRKVVAEYSSKAQGLAAARAKHDDQVAETEAQPKQKPTASKSGSAAAVGAGNGEDNKLETVDVLYWKSLNHSLFLIAKANGYFRDEGLNVRLHEAPTYEASQIAIAVAEGGTPANRPVVGMDPKKRKYFLGAVCPSGFHEALSKGIPLVQIGGMLEEPMSLIMKKELAEEVAKNLSAFSGHSLARLRNAPSKLEYILMFAGALQAREIPYSEKFFNSAWDMEQALVRGEVDAVNSTPPYDQEIVDRHPTLGLFPLRSIYPVMTCCRQLVTRDQLKDKKMRDKYVRFERAVIRAHRFYTVNKADAVEIVARYLSTKPSVVREVFMRKGYALDPNPNDKGSQALYRALKSKVGTINSLRESIDTSIYEEALLALAKENPEDTYFTDAIRRYRATN